MEGAMSWIVRDRFYQANRNEYVDRHYTVAVEAKAKALHVMNKWAAGTLSVVGYVFDNGATHYYSAQA